MIEIDGVIAWSDTERAAYTESRALEINIAASNLRRAVDFYARVFGLRPRGDHGGSAPAVLRVTRGADLVIHELRGSIVLPPPFVRAWGFVVTNLDVVRQQIWELGVTVARDSGAPDQIYRWSSGRSLYVFAPDGNQIELVEIGRGACAGGIRAAQVWPHRPYDSASKRSDRAALSSKSASAR